MREYLTREELRQDFADEAEKAWADYEKTGLHVTLDEVDARAKSLGTRDAAARAVNVIVDRLGALARFPHLGPVDPDRPDTRQLFNTFGAAGYVARYRVLDDTVTVLAIRPMREAGYAEEPPKPPPRDPSSRRRRS